jgi:hypothetical protein
MKQWSYDRQITINTSIYLEQETLKPLLNEDSILAKEWLILRQPPKASASLFALPVRLRKQRESVNRSRSIVCHGEDKAT